MQGLGRVASDGSEGADTPATASAFGERLLRAPWAPQAATAGGFGEGGARDGTTAGGQLAAPGSPREELLMQRLPRAHLGVITR